jgi:hypothetical protein
VVDYANATIEIAITKILLKNGFMQLPFESQFKIIFAMFPIIAYILLEEVFNVTFRRFYE